MSIIIVENRNGNIVANSAEVFSDAEIVDSNLQLNLKAGGGYTVKYTDEDTEARDDAFREVVKCLAGGKAPVNLTDFPLTKPKAKPKDTDPEGDSESEDEQTE